MDSMTNLYQKPLSYLSMPVSVINIKKFLIVKATKFGWNLYGKTFTDPLAIRYNRYLLKRK